MITICTTRPFTVRVQAPCRAPWPKLCPNLGECDSTEEEISMPSARGSARRPGTVGAAVPPARPAAPGPAAPSGPDRPDDGGYQAGQDLEVTVGDVAQGGWCIARP